MNRTKIVKLLAYFICCCSLFFVMPSQYVAFEQKTLDEVETIDKAGTYKVILSIPDKDGKLVQKEILITISFPRSVVNEQTQEGIDARDIKVKKADFFQLSADNFISIAGAHAWSLQDGQKVPITQVTTNVKDESNDLYHITFQTAKGTMTTTNIWLMETDFLLADGYLQTIDIFNAQKPIKLSTIFLFLLLIPVVLIILMVLILTYYQRYINKTLYFLSKDNKINSK